MNYNQNFKVFKFDHFRNQISLLTFTVFLKKVIKEHIIYNNFEYNNSANEF